MPFKNIKPESLFKCKKCGECCKGYGGTYLTDQDIDSISHFIGILPNDLKKDYCTMSNNKPLIKQKTDGYCIFWDNACTIQPFKPKMCKDWPFIPSVLADPKNWSMMASVCPGMRTNFPDSVIARCVRSKIKDRK